MSTFDARTSGILEVDSAEALAALRQKVRAGEIRLSNQLKGKLNFAEECLKAQLRSDGLPKGFAQALFTAILWSGLTQKAVAEQVGVKASTIGDWARGKCSPDARQIIFVSRIETRLGLKAGTLIDRVKRRGRGSGKLPAYLVPLDLQGRDNAELRKLIRRGLPVDLLDYEEDEQHRIFADVRARCERTMKKKSVHSKLTSERYSFNRWGETLRRQFDEMCAAQGELLPNTGIKSRKKWSKSTQTMVRRDISKIIGFAIGEHAGAHRLHGEPTLAILANPELVQASFVFRINRKRVAGEEEPMATECDASTLGRIAREFRPFGWIREAKEIRSELSYDCLSDALWYAHCDEIGSKYEALAKRTRQGCGKTRPNRDLVKPVLNRKSPLGVVKFLLDCLKEDLALEDEAQAAARIAEDIVYVHLQAQAPMRPFSSVRLRYRPDNSGHLVKENGIWKLRVPKELFKNRNSSVLEHDFERDLEDQWGFYGDLEAFLKKHRFDILQNDSPFLFNHSPNNVARAAVSSADDWDAYAPMIANLALRVQKMTRVHLAWDPVSRTGIEGIDHFTTTSFRHIGATEDIKRSGDPQQAADRLANTVEVTSEHYAQWLMSDRKKALRLTQQKSARYAERDAEKLRKSAGRRRKARH